MGMTLRRVPSGSTRNAACHSWRPYTESMYSGERTAIIRSQSRTPSTIRLIQCEPGTKSHAWIITWKPSASSCHAIHSAHLASAAVYETKKSTRGDGHIPVSSPAVSLPAGGPPRRPSIPQILPHDHSAQNGPAPRTARFQGNGESDPQRAARPPVATTTVETQTEPE